MTKEEAIAVLKRTLAYDSEFADAKEIAIEALGTEIVRCKDCKHAFINTEHERKPLICGLTKMCGTTKPMWFCADGEKSTYVEVEVSK